MFETEGWGLGLSSGKTVAYDTWITRTGNWIIGNNGWITWFLDLKFGKGKFNTLRNMTLSVHTGVKPGVPLFMLLFSAMPTCWNVKSYIYWSTFDKHP